MTPGYFQKILSNRLLPNNDDTPIEVLKKAVMGIETCVIGLSSNLEEVTKATLARFESDESEFFIAGVIQSVKASVGTVPSNMDPKFLSSIL